MKALQEKVTVIKENLVKMLPENVAMMWKNLEMSRSNAQTLSTNNVRLASEVSILKVKVVETRAEIIELKTFPVQFQDAAFQVLLYKIIRSKAFCQYFNQCSMASLLWL